MPPRPSTPTPGAAPQAAPAGDARAARMRRTLEAIARFEWGADREDAVTRALREIQTMAADALS